MIKEDSIQLKANRIRCSVCNADSSECVFFISNEIRFRYSFNKPTVNEPIFYKENSKKIRLNKTQRIDTNSILNRVCLRCGTIRKGSVPNILI